jgi:hypothetical protein
MAWRLKMMEYDMSSEESKHFKTIVKTARELHEKTAYRFHNDEGELDLENLERFGPTVETLPEYLDPKFSKEDAQKYFMFDKFRNQETSGTPQEPKQAPKKPKKGKKGAKPTDE